MTDAIDDRASGAHPRVYLRDPVLGDVQVGPPARRSDAEPDGWGALDVEQALRSVARCRGRLPSLLRLRELGVTSWRDAPVEEVLAAGIRRGVVRLYTRTFDAGRPGGEPVEPVTPRPARPAPVSLRTWIGVRVVDTEGAAVSRQRLDVVDPDGACHPLITDDDGNVRLDAISAGVCDVALRALDGRDWSIEGGGDDGDLRPDEPSHDHVAAAGDCLSSLARRKGFRSLQPLIRANGELLATRQNPNVLAEGDRIVVPERLLRVEPCPTGRVHVAIVAADRVLLRLKLQACEAGTQWRLVVAGSTVSRGVLVAEQDGSVLTGEVPASAPRAELALDELPPRRLILLLGRMAPWDVEQGWRARLHNLGYLGSPGAEVGALRRGVALFQRDHGLAVDGHAGPRTLAILRDVHGC